MSKEIAVPMKTGIEQMFEKANYLIEKKLVPATLNKPETLLQIISVGASLGLDEMASVNSIDIIQGAIAIKAKVIPGLLAKHGIAIEVIKDYEPIVIKKPTPLKDADGKPMVDENGVMTYYRDPLGNIVYKEEETGDYITSVRFKRFFPNIGVVENVVDFKWSMAVAAEWHTKSNWKKMPSYMMMARCISKGARIAAGDILAGLYDNYEVAEFTGADFDVDDEGDLLIKNK